MAKKISSTVKEIDLSMVEQRLTALDESLAANDEVLASLNQSFDELHDIVSKIKPGSGPLGVTTIDPNMHFQECLTLAMTSIIQTRNINLILKRPDHLELMIDDILTLAEKLHEQICNRFVVT